MENLHLKPRLPDLDLAVVGIATSLKSSRECTICYELATYTSEMLDPRGQILWTWPWRLWPRDPWPC